MDLLDTINQLEREASAFGFQWENPNQIMEQIQSECEEIKAHLHTNERAALQEEIGDLLHAVFSLCVFCQFDPHETLQQTSEKFARRLAAVKVVAEEKGLSQLHGLSFTELMAIWQQAKERVG